MLLGGVMDISDKLTNFFIKVILLPFVLFITYATAWWIGVIIASEFFAENNIKFVVLMIVITSVLCFISTILIHFITTKLKTNIVFKNWFEWCHLMLMYVSGLLAAIIVLNPVFKEVGIIVEVNYNMYAFSATVFFILTFNYYFYKALIINRDINLVPYINEKVRRYFGKEILIDSKEKIVRKYFKCWIDDDISIVEKYLDNNIIYEESWGAVYMGLEQVKIWFADWHKNNKVIQWDIKKVTVLDKKVICEWYFKGSCNGYIDRFNGVSVVDFNNKNKIVGLKEYMAEIPLVYPYRYNKSII